MRGYSESASKNTSVAIFQITKYSKIRIFENSLASDLVFVGEYGIDMTVEAKHTSELLKL